MSSATATSPRARLALPLALAFVLLAQNGPLSAASISRSRAQNPFIRWLPIDRDGSASTYVDHFNPVAAGPAAANYTTGVHAAAVARAATAYPAATSWTRTFGGFTIGAATPTVSSGLAATAAPVSLPAVYSAPSAVSNVSAPASPGTISISAMPVSAGLNVTHASSSAAATAPTPDAFINFGGGPFAEASALTTGGGQAWFNSPSVKQVYGGNAPDAAQQADFTNQVLNDVRKTFNNAGLSPNVTLDPNAQAGHTLSVVSGTTYGPNPNAIGITDVGANGFGFIDKLAYAKTPGELALAVAHNVSHELMHAFGVAAHDDPTGQYLDAAVARWELLTDPNATFSAQAVSDIRAGLQARAGSLTSASGPVNAGEGADFLEMAPFAAPVPEPASYAAWAVGLAAAFWVRRRRVRA